MAEWFDLQGLLSHPSLILITIYVGIMGIYTSCPFLGFGSCFHSLGRDVTIWSVGSCIHWLALRPPISHWLWQGAPAILAVITAVNLHKG